MVKASDYIGVFDSGVGGISVLRALMAEMPNERYLYYGDSANAPYGVRPHEQIRHLVLAVAQKLVAQGCKALVVACNTATAVCLELLRETYPELIVVGIEPAVVEASRLFPQGDVGVLATPVTISSNKFDSLVARCEPGCQIYRFPAPKLADLVEAGLGESAESEALLKPILAPWAGKLDALVLGCTHYPFTRNTIGKLLGPDTVLMDGVGCTTENTKQALQERGLLHDGPGELVIQNSDPDPRLVTLCRTLLET